MRSARINVKLLILLGVVVSVGATGLVVAHTIRKRVTAQRALTAGEKAFAEKNWEEASKQYRTYLGKFPTDEKILEQFALAQLSIRPARTETISSAITAYRKLYRNKQGDKDLSERLMKLYYYIGDFTETRYITRSRLSVSRDDETATLWQGRAILAQRKFEDLKDQLKPFVERNPKAVPIYILLAQGAQQEGGSTSNPDNDPKKWLDDAVKANPTSAEALVARADYFIEHGTKGSAQLSQAREDLEAADKLKIDSAAVRLQLANCWMNLNIKDPLPSLDPIRAEIAAARTLPLAPDAHFDFEREEAKLDLLRTAGQLILLEGNAEEALKLAEEGLNELTLMRRTQFLPVAVNLYVLAKKPEPARKALEELRGAIAESIRQNRLIAEKFALLEAQVSNAELKPYAALAKIEEVLSTAQAQDPRVLKELGYAYSATRQDRRAIAAFEEYLAKSPQEVSVLLDLAKLYYRAADWPRTYKFAGQVLEQSPGDFAAQIMWMEALLKGGLGKEPTDAQINDVAEHLQKLRTVKPKSVEVRILQAQVANKRQGVDAAIKELQLAEKECTETMPATMELVRLQQLSGRKEAALQTARAAVDQDRKLVQPWLALAALQELNGDKESATRTLKEALKELEGEDKTAVGLALSTRLFADEQIQEMVERLQELCKERPTDIAPRGRLLDVVHELAVAIKPQTLLPESACQDLVEEIKKIEGPNGLRWRFEQARLFLRRPNWRADSEEIIRLLTKVVEGDTSWEAPVVALGGVYEVSGQEGPAENVYRRYVENHPRSIFAASKLLELLERQGRWTQANQVLERIDFGDDSSMAGHRTMISVGRGDFDQAITTLEKHLKEKPKDATSRVVLARLIYARAPANEKEAALNKAMATLDEAEKLAPEMLVIGYTRATLYNTAGRKADALAAINAQVEKRKDYAAYELRADYYSADGQLELAEKDYQHLLTFPTSVTQGAKALGEFYERTGRPEQALAAYQKGLEVDKENGVLRLGTARALILTRKADNQQRGREILEELLAKKANDSGLLTVKAQSLMMQAEQMSDPAASYQKRKEAIGIFETVAKLDPRNIQAHLQLIKWASAQGDLAKASQIAAQAIGANPENVDLLLVRASVESDAKNIVSATNLANSVLQQDIDNVPARNLLTDLSLSSKDLKGAEEHNARVLKRDPGNEDGRILQARIAEARGDSAKAIKMLEEFRSSPAGAQSMKAALKLSDLYRAAKMYDKCEQQLDILEKAAPEFFNIFVVRLQILADQKRFDDFIKLLETRLKARAEPQALITAATILAETAPLELERAKPLFVDFVNRNPNNIHGHLALAVVRLSTLDTKGARESYEAALKIDPYHQLAMNNLAWILSQELGKYDEALSLANNGVLRYPDDPSMLNTRGVILFNKSDFDKSRVDFEKCLKLPMTSNGTRARSLIYLGKIAVKQSDPRQAQSLLTQAMEIEQKFKVLNKTERAELEKLVGQPTTRAAAG